MPTRPRASKIPRLFLPPNLPHRFLQQHHTSRTPFTQPKTHRCLCKHGENGTNYTRKSLILNLRSFQLPHSPFSYLLPPSLHSCIHPYSNSPTTPLTPPQTNTPQTFTWAGSIPLIFGGEHSFRFAPSHTTPGGTTFTQEESFSGALGFLMGEGFIAKKLGFGAKTILGWEGYNRDFKGWCEKA